MEGVLELYSQTLKVRENFVAPLQSIISQEGAGENDEGLVACSRKISSVTDSVAGTDVRFQVDTSKIKAFTVTDGTTFILSLDEVEPDENVIDEDDQ